VLYGLLYKINYINNEKANTSNAACCVTSISTT
jgi:hypothetical protein